MPLSPNYKLSNHVSIHLTEPGSFALFAFSELHLICVFYVFFICLLSCIFQNIQSNVNGTV